MVLFPWKQLHVPSGSKWQAAGGRELARRPGPSPAAKPSRMHRGAVGRRAERRRETKPQGRPRAPAVPPLLGHMYIWALWARLQPISQADPPRAFHKRLLGQSRWQRLNQDGSRPGGWHPESTPALCRRPFHPPLRETPLPTSSLKRAPRSVPHALPVVRRVTRSRA